MASEDVSPPAPGSRRRLIINADDFGFSGSVNEAVLRAHREGVLTSASLMVNEPGFEQAVEIARANPQLGLGLHLVLVCGHSSLPQDQIPGLVDARQEFLCGPVRSGLRFFFNRRLRKQLRAEIHAQFRKFHSTGLPLDHVNGHLHLHLHPVVLRILADDAAELGIRAVRLTRDPFRLNRQLSSGRFWYRASHAAVFGWLAARARPVLARGGHRHADRVFGLLQDGRVDQGYVIRLLERLPPGVSELYSHPSLHEFSHEFEALVSPAVRAALWEQKIELIRHSDLYHDQTARDSAYRAGV